jgi:CHAT domain-containing protein/tetratricopeptide (TPR) repeat protein
LLLLQQSQNEQTATSTPIAAPGVIEVSPGMSIRRSCTPGQQETFAIVMQPEQLLNFSINKGDLAITIEAYDPAGTKLLEYASRNYETIESSLISETAGSYKLVIKSSETSGSDRPYELRLQLVKALTKPGRSDYEARKLTGSATLLRSQWTSASLQEAIEKYDKAALLWKAEGNITAAAQALLEAGEVCFLLSEYTNALKRYQTAVQLTAATDDELTTSRALTQVGLVSSYLGKNDEAQVHLTNALRFLESADEGQEGSLLRHALAEGLSSLGEVTYAKGNLVRSMAHFERARQIFAEIGDRNGQARMLLFAGYAAGSLGETQKAIFEVYKALKLFREVTNRAGEARALTALGLASSLKRDEDGAIDLHREALKTFQTIGDRNGEAVTLNALGQSYENLHEYSIALDNYQKAFDVFQKISALDLASVTMCKIAAVYRLGANMDQALSHFERCLDMSRSAGKTRTEAIALEEVAGIYVAQGQLKQTQAQYQKLQSFYGRLGDVYGQASALNSSGDSFLLLGQRHRALAAYTQALPLSEKASDTGLIVGTLYNLARVYRDLGSLEAALAYVDRSLKIVEDVRRNVGGPDSRASYFSGMRKYYDLRIDILMQLDRAQPGKDFGVAAFLTSENARARSLLDLLAETRADVSSDVSPNLLNRERELQALLRAQAQYLMELSIRGRDYREMAEVNVEIDQLRSEYLELQSSLAEHSKHRFAQVDSATLRLDQVQNELHDPNTILLEFALGEPRSYLWVVTHDSFRGYELPAGQILHDEASEVYKLLTARQDLEGDSYTDRIERADNHYFEKSTTLSQMLLGQIADQLIKSKRLVIVSEGALQYISFEALPLPTEVRERVGLRAEDRPYLIATHEIVRLPSIATLIAIRNTARRPPSANSLVAVFADPVFSKTDERVSNHPAEPEAKAANGDLETMLSEPKLPALGPEDSSGPVRLSYTANEANAILTTTPRGMAFVAEGFDANREMAMSSQIGQFQIVHFATHSFLNSEHPELSGLVLTMVDANGTRKNGLMLLADIYNLNLSAELTVLSACDTALGKDLEGEGLVGFTHSFLSAGSKSIIASLWKVDDRSTAMLMSDFYRSMLQNGMPPSAALRAAKLKLLKEQRWRTPYFWAGFVFQGEYENRITVNKKLSPNLALILIAPVFLILAVLMIYLRRQQRNASSYRLESRTP